MGTLSKKKAGMFMIRGGFTWERGAHGGGGYVGYGTGLREKVRQSPQIVVGEFRRQKLDRSREKRGEEERCGE